MISATPKTAHLYQGRHSQPDPDGENPVSSANLN